MGRGPGAAGRLVGFVELYVRRESLYLTPAHPNAHPWPTLAHPGPTLNCTALPPLQFMLEEIGATGDQGVTSEWTSH